MGNLILKLLTYLQIQECSDRVMWRVYSISIMANMAIGQGPTANVQFSKISSVNKKYSSRCGSMNMNEWLICS